MIGADGGVKHILKLGLIPQIIIGDLDSISKETGMPVPNNQISNQKGQNGFELAIDYCLKNKFQEIIIFGIFR